ncbi:class I adenylate-forming enzyme family protein [Nocardia sp. NPDC046473]|uniref:class I adenylate-forming enzyme family protein n=1 Tax=Nocardia sp. NPDC046473 TaxID=3155733 RepID=UPI0033CF6564
MSENVQGREPLDYPAIPIDGLLQLSARRDPHRTAIRTDAVQLSFAELEAIVSSVAGSLANLAGGPGVAIAVATTLDPAFAVAFNAVSRSGNVIVTINPLLRDAALEHILNAAEVQAAFVPTELYRRLAPLRDRLPKLATLILLDNGDESTTGTTLLADLARNGAAAPPARSTDLGALACIQFTSGTTGMPKAVMLSHRNLVANAVQVATAHGLSSAAITLNHLPAYHLMHLNSAIYAGASQVLCLDPDPVASIAAAVEHQATHYYGLPVRLSRLAEDPRLPDLRAGMVRAMYSGGSALAPAVTTILARQFGIPVVQGYGLAEASPLTHCDLPDAPRLGSVGPTVRDTECRIVHVDTRTPLPAGINGEVLVRGPQVMIGYLHSPDSTAIDADGWCSTGDIGYQDDDGWLFLVDRLKDVFKCDNELVSPAEIEYELNQHPAVRECVVVDYPDKFSGAVAYAFVVLHDPSDPVDLARIMQFVNEKMSYYQKIHHLECVDSIPRSPIGKIQRRVIREQLHAQLQQANNS